MQEAGGEVGGAGGRTDARSQGRTAGRTAGRFSIHSAMASFMRGASARHPGEALDGLEGQQGRGQTWSSPWHHQLSQAAPEGRAGLPCPPGNQQRTRRQVEGVDPFRAVNGDLQAFSSRLSGCTPFWEFSRRCPTLQMSSFSLDTSPCLLAQGSLGTLPVGPLGTRALPFLSAHTVLPHPRASGSLAQVSDGGEWEKNTAPEGQRVLSRACQPPSSGREPPGPTINISSVGGILRPP